LIIYTYQKSKKRKPNAKQRELQISWNKILEKYPVVKSIHKVKPLAMHKPYVRETPNYPSLKTTLPMTCTKPIEGKRYTGDKMLGIGTLHKSNAVPIFSADEAKDQATMRR